MGRVQILALSRRNSQLSWSFHLTKHLQIRSCSFFLSLLKHHPGSCLHRAPGVPSMQVDSQAPPACTGPGPGCPSQRWCSATALISAAAPWLHPWAQPALLAVGYTKQLLKVHDSVLQFSSEEHNTYSLERSLIGNSHLYYLLHYKWLSLSDSVPWLRVKDIVRMLRGETALLQGFKYTSVLIIKTISKQGIEAHPNSRACKEPTPALAPFPAPHILWENNGICFQ